MGWKITSDSYADVEFSTVGISSCRVVLDGPGGDRCTIFIPAEDAGAVARPFEERENVSIKEPGGTWYFRGWVRSCASGISGDRSGWEVELWGNLRKLDRLPYMQQVPLDSGATMTWVSRGTLGYDDAGTRLNTAQVIGEVLSYAATPAGLSAGAILTGTTVTAPEMDFAEMTCREVINRVLMWHPDATLRYDHAAGTVLVTRPGSMAVVTVASGGTGSGAVEVEIDSLRREPVAGVTILWEQTSVVDGVTYMTRTPDSAGTAAPALDVVVIDIPIAGEEITTVSQEVLTATVPRGLDDFTAGEWVTFLLANFPQIKAAAPVEGQLVMVSAVQTVDETAKVGLGTVPTYGVDELPAYPRRLVGGSVPPWQSGISAAPVQLTITLRPGPDVADNPALWALFDQGEAKSCELHLNCTGTDAETTTYRTVTAYEAAESPVTGLAADFYAAMSASAPSGVISLSLGTPNVDLAPGKKITLEDGSLVVTGAVIQSVQTDVMTGRQVVRFGPNGVIQPPDFVQLLRAGSRAGRMRNTGGASRTSSEAAGKEIKGGVAAPDHHTARSVPVGWRPFACSQVGEVADGKVSIKVGVGVVHAGTGLSASATPIKVADPFRSYPTEDWTVADVEDGHSIWAKIGLTKTHGYVVTATTTVDIGGTTYNISVDTQQGAYEYAGLDETDRYVTSATRPASAGVDFTGVDAGDACWVYAEIARVSITDGTVTIRPVQTSALVVPMVPVLDEGSAVSMIAAD